MSGKKGGSKDQAKGSQPAKNRGAVSLGGGVVMTSAIASSFVSVGLWIAEDFFHLNIPAHLAPPLATVVLFLVAIVRVVAIAIAGFIAFIIASLNPLT